MSLTYFPRTASNIGPTAKKPFFAAAMALVVMGCGSGENASSSGSGTSSGEGSSSSGSSSSGNPSGLCGGTGVAPSVFEPLPTKAACASPTATKTLAIDNGFFGSPALASCGGIIGFAYFQGQSSIMFQALDTSGMPLGDPLTVGSAPNTLPIRASIATNRQSFMVCYSDWDMPLQFICAAVDPDQRTVTKGKAVPGSAVEVTWGVGGYVALYREPTTNALTAQRIGDDALPVGDAIDLGVTIAPTSRVDIAPQSTTYAFAVKGVFGNLDGKTLLPTDTPNTAADIAGDFVELAATSKASAIVYASGKVRESVVAAGTTQPSPPVDLNSTAAATLHTDVTASDSSFAAVWGAGQVLQYRAFDEVGTLLGSSETALFDDGQSLAAGVAIAATNNAFVVVGAQLQSMSVARIDCP